MKGRNDMLLWFPENVARFILILTCQLLTRHMRLRADGSNKSSKQGSLQQAIRLLVIGFRILPDCKGVERMDNRPSDKATNTTGCERDGLLVHRIDVIHSFEKTKELN